MKKILGLGVVAFLIMALAAGGTWAFFSDYEASSDNVLTAGTLDVGLSNTNGGATGGGVSATWSLSNMAPGGTKVGTLYVANNGTIAMSTVNITASYNTSGTVPATVKAGPGGATDQIEKMIYISAATWNGTTVNALLNKSIFDLATQNITLGALGPNLQSALDVTWTFNSSATNGCQNRTVTMNVTIYATQN